MGTTVLASHFERKSVVRSGTCKGWDNDDGDDDDRLITNFVIITI